MTPAPNPVRQGVLFAPTDYAPFWRRLLAIMIDLSITFFAGIMTGIFMSGMDSRFLPGMLAVLFVAWCYLALLKRTRLGTVGFMAAGIRIVDLEGKSPLAKTPVATTMSFTFAGRARFSITKGRWITFSGRMRMRSTGFMKSDVEQVFALSEKKATPADDGNK